MHTGVISFCDRIHFNVKCSVFKGELLKRLDAAYGLKIIARHSHRLDENGMQLVTNPRSSHWMCFRSNGNPYFMVLFTYEDVPMIVYVDKKIQPGYEFPRMLLGRGQFPPKAFEGNGTVLDGEMVKDNRGGWAFLINDVIAYAGRPFASQHRHHHNNINLKHRLETAIELLNGHIHDPYMDSCVYHVKRYFAPTQEGFTYLLEMAADLPYTHRGVYFWPDNARFKPKLHNFDDSIIKPVVRKVKDEPAFREANTSVPQAPTPPTPVMPVPQGDVVTLWLNKTENPDVYDVYKKSAPGCNTKIGIAGVPTLVVSKMLRNVFKMRTIAQPAAFECTWHEAFQKYVPVRMVGS